eukprot:462641-Prymnesium_polylepis.2
MSSLTIASSQPQPGEMTPSAPVRSLFTPQQQPQSFWESTEPSCAYGRFCTECVLRSRHVTITASRVRHRASREIL